MLVSVGVGRVAVVLAALVSSLGCGGRPAAPLRNTSEPPVVRAEEPIVDDGEWLLLHGVALGRPGSLGALASFYQHYGAWDEYSAVRTRMLEDARSRPGSAPSRAPARVPGGPFPRIGAPRPPGEVPPPTVLSRWLDPGVVPELFAAKEPSLDELEQSLVEAVRASDPGRESANRVRLADVLCVRLRFAEAVEHYAAALAALRSPPDVPRVRARLEDARRILRPGSERIADGITTIFTTMSVTARVRSAR